MSIEEEARVIYFYFIVNKKEGSISAVDAKWISGALYKKGEKLEIKENKMTRSCSTSICRRDQSGEWYMARKD